MTSGRPTKNWSALGTISAWSDSLLVPRSAGSKDPALQTVMKASRSVGAGLQTRPVV
jgi:hypothetical protein